MKLQFKEVKHLKYFRMCFFFLFRRHKIQIIRFCLPFDVLKLKSDRRFQLTFNACRLIKGKSLRLHFDAILGFFYITVTHLK